MISTWENPKMYFRYIICQDVPQGKSRMCLYGTEIEQDGCLTQWNTKLM